MKNEELLEALRDEIKELRKELRRSRSEQHIHHHYAPQPVYVPSYPIQPSYPWWTTGEIINIDNGSRTFTTRIEFTG